MFELSFTGIVAGSDVHVSGLVDGIDTQGFFGAVGNSLAGDAFSANYFAY